MTDAEQQEIRQAFAVECPELLGEMESALLSLEADISSADEFNRLFRAIHTIKGSAGIIGFEMLEQFCHSIEHLLVRIREHTLVFDRPLIALLLAGHDHINSMVEQFCRGASAGPVSIPDAHSSLLRKMATWEAAAPGNIGGIDESGSQVLQASKSDGGKSRSSLRIDAAKLDQLSNLIIELVTASSSLESQVRHLGDLATIEATSHVTGLVAQIQKESMVFRMLPVQSLFHRFERVIHDSGTVNGKDIRLQISGGETELDKAVAEKLYDPLLHLVRNAVDHGIEASRDRTAAGKPAAGTIQLQARQDSGNIVISVSDDGRGINMGRVAQKGVALGLLKSEAGASEREVLNCIFEPGLSTLDEATTLSGRGMGMNVVKKAVDSLRGRVDIHSAKGVGTTFRISIPSSISLVDGFLVAVGEERYLLPMAQVQETIELPDISVPGAMTNGCLKLREQALACLDLKAMFAVTGPPRHPRYVVVVSCEGQQRVGLIVDQLLGDSRAVIKPLGPMFRQVDCISGASILGDGSIALFLDIDRLIASIVTL